MASIDDFTYAQGRNGTVTGLIGLDDGANHQVEVTRWFMSRSADEFDLSNFAGDDEKVGHGHIRSRLIFSGWLGNKSGVTPGSTALGGAGASTTLTADTGRTFSGTAKAGYMQVDVNRAARDGRIPVLVRAKFHGSVSETWS